ncbi:chemotaxis protein [Nibricoccus aquaticus]|uniref:Chemotaxis protein n=1 Tax=Nibricoccus aquaticus TaxID=2576891 RepID=A0A290Q829_9BACT|nr:methyl-accepting chemotaxis protein [Nibricoccus aquaticus]ATC64875.1 chemotaxis protein [Nibricoccus aquaticus]
MLSPAASIGSSSEIVATPERISALTATLQERIRGSIQDIGTITLQSRVLSINAQIEAARAGESGKSFAIVGQEMVTFSNRIQSAAKSLEQDSQTLVMELAEISRVLATRVRGTRLSDLALTNIDLIDRNLYERSCDCRWWATDAAMVNALENPGDDQIVNHASERLGVILKAYTVYFDIVLADLDGRIIANGRPADYASVGVEQGEAAWFKTAMATASGDEFGFQSVTESTLVGGERVLVYSCKVCRGGSASAEPVGVLGVIFNWDGLAQKIMHETPIESEKKALTRVCIVDDAGTVLADSEDKILKEKMDLPDCAGIFAKEKTCATLTISGRDCLVAHAKSPGFETYKTGWHSLIIERMK